MGERDSSSDDSSSSSGERMTEKKEEKHRKKKHSSKRKEKKDGKKEKQEKKDGKKKKRRSEEEKKQRDLVKSAKAFLKQQIKEADRAAFAAPPAAVTVASVDKPQQAANWAGWHLQPGAGAGVDLTAAELADAEMEERRAAAAAARAAARGAGRAAREELEEMLPRATGREAKVEARIARREEERARGESPEATTLPGGGDVLGGTDSFAAALARQKRAEAARQQRGRGRGRGGRRGEAGVSEERMAAFQVAEAERTEKFRAILAAASSGGGRMTIAPRTD